MHRTGHGDLNRISVDALGTCIARNNGYLTMIGVARPDMYTDMSLNIGTRKLSLSRSPSHCTFKRLR